MKLSKSVFIVSILLLLSGVVYASAGDDYTEDRIYTRAEIVKIEKVPVDEGQGIKLYNTKVYLKVLDGELEGQVKTALFGGESDLPVEMTYEKGDVVFVGIGKSYDSASTGYISIYDHDNSVGIIVLALLMAGAIIAVGRLKGLSSLIALIVTVCLLFLVLIPLTLKGYPPLPVSVLLAVVSILITLPLIAGIELKTLCAILGASSGIVLAALLAILFGLFMHLSGIVTNDMLTIFYASDVNIDLRGLVLSGMVISALGAVMDICISIASSTSEIFNVNPAIDEMDAFRSVMNIGKDILGSMVNTLILAYVGSSLAMILWISMKLQPGMPFMMVLNYNPILSEIVKSVIGSIGMFVSIPLTAFISVKLHRRRAIKQAAV